MFRLDVLFFAGVGGFLGRGVLTFGPLATEVTVLRLLLEVVFRFLRLEIC